MLARCIVIILSCLHVCSLQAETLTVAVASNFATAAQALVEHFGESTGHTVRTVTASTGKLYAQIENGAPFDVLLAADTERPALLEASGAGIADSRFTYAIGRLVLWSGDATLAGSDCRSLLQDLDNRHLAIANPMTAPYGAAAVAFLKNDGSWQDTHARLVYGENIAQTLHFVVSGNASLGLIAASQAADARLPEASCAWPVPQAMHAPIEQQAIQLRRAVASAVAADFMAFLRGSAAANIVLAHGYEVPGERD